MRQSIAKSGKRWCYVIQTDAFNLARAVLGITREEHPVLFVKPEDFWPAR
jgi:hypothetical protein